MPFVSAIASVRRPASDSGVSGSAVSVAGGAGVGFFSGVASQIVDAGAHPCPLALLRGLGVRRRP